MTDFLEQARVARSVGNAEAAYQFLVSAVSSAPCDEVWSMLGQSLYELKRYGAAAAAFGRVREPEYRGLVNLGWNLHLCGRGEEAEEALRRGATIAPTDDALPWTNLSQCQLRLGDIRGAVENSRVATGMSPDPIHHVAYAMALFAAGLWEEGFREYEARIPYKMPTMLQYPYPRWDGVPVGRVGTLFVQAEMGIGDTIWMMRHMPEVVRRVDRTVWYVHPELLKLAQAFMPGVEVFPMPRELPDADAWTPMLSLPTALGWGKDGEGSCGAYLWDWGNPPTPHAGFRVGIAWAGSPENEEAVWKDVPLAEFLPLMELPGIEFHSLQVGRATDIPALGLHGVLRDRSPEIRDMADTASIVAGLNLVICSDSAVAHLAGAMGKPVWMLRNARAAPWIWPMAREETPWYSTMRVLTRGRSENWSDLMFRVRDRLHEFAKEKAL